MPITRKQFELGIDPKMEKYMRSIHKFLSDNKDAAFTEGELRIAILGKSWQIGEREALDTALVKLVFLQAVQSRIIRDEDYYTCGRFPLKI